MFAEIEKQALNLAGYLPFAGSIATVGYALYSGSIPIKGKHIKRDADPSTYWWVIVLILMMMSLPSFLVVTFH